MINDNVMSLKPRAHGMFEYSTYIHSVLLIFITFINVLSLRVGVLKNVLRVTIN